MSRKRPNLDHSAYAASQPLFSALRNAASTSIPAQKSNLTTARDVVQSLHVKIADTDNTHNDITRHEQYMDSAVKAWSCAVDAYCEIFTEMVKITGSEPSEGREEGSRHQEFVAMLESAQKARSIVEEFSKTQEAANTNEKPADSDESSEIAVTSTKNDQGKRSRQSNTSRPKGVTREGSQPKDEKLAPLQREHRQLAQKSSTLNGNIRYDKSGEKVLWENGELKVPYLSMDAAERRAWDLIKRKAKRKSRHQAAKRAHGNKSAEPQNQATDASAATQEPAVNGAKQADSGVGNVEYEDVSAEVERRMKAKAEKKAAEKAKKSEKKRKRESADSAIAAAAATDGDSITVTQKPLKKKAKNGAGDESEIPVNGVGKDIDARTSSGKLPKRKKESVGEAAELDGTQTSKKQRKRKS